MSVTVKREWGAMVVTDTSLNRRYWFDETERGNIILAAVVTGMDHTRHYHDRENWEVPTVVSMALDAAGYDHVYDSNGDELA